MALRQSLAARQHQTQGEHGSAGRWELQNILCVDLNTCVSVNACVRVASSMKSRFHLQLPIL